MSNYTLLYIFFIQTFVIFGLAYLIWLKTRTMAFVVSIGIIFYWTMFGTCKIIFDMAHEMLLFSEGGVFSRLFQVELDATYLKTILLYFLFIVIIELTVLAGAKKIENKESVRFIPSYKLIMLSIFFGLIAFLSMKSELALAREANVSFYVSMQYTKSESYSYTLHLITDFLAFIPLAIGLAAFFSGKNPKFLKTTRNVYALLGYILAIIFLFWINLSMGAKSYLFFGALLTTFIYLSNARKPKYLLSIVLILASMGTIGLIDTARRFSINESTNILSMQGVIKGLGIVMASNESIGAHSSLYGALLYDVPQTHGSSFISLAASVVPKFLWKDRPPKIYYHYAKFVGAASDQGFTIHHATGWYLNFGILGIIAGAFLFGLLWVTLYNCFQKRMFFKGSIFKTWATISFWIVSAQIPTIIREGPEGYKAIILLGMVIPTLIIHLASSRIVYNIKK